MTKAKPSVKSKSATAPNSGADPEFVLKHRVVGAAFLLFFGALFLPWVLGAPGSSSESPSSSKLEGGELTELVNSGSTEQMADELAEALASEQVAVEEQVYISKITPLGSGTTDNNSRENEAVSETKAVEMAPEAADSEAKVEEQASAAPAANDIDTESRKSEAPRATAPGATAPANQVAAAAPQIEVGWVVQVGVFTDKKGADRVVADLQSKGFSPSTTIVDTNRGKASGTRIWLGPYAQRVAAAKAKAELNQKTGEAGFIRAYP